MLLPILDRRCIILRSNSMDLVINHTSKHSYDKKRKEGKGEPLAFVLVTQAMQHALVEKTRK